ncbi:MAG: site-specific DNA-methyltransferase, partial [Christensenellales bacterium]
IEKDIKGKKYGLVFEEHRESIDEVLEYNLPVLTEEADLFIDNGGQMNFLIEGDNLASLKLLEKTHKGKIDLIYIDPPYNTGNKDFVYDDSFVDSNDTFRHSKWLSFMEKRLQIARNLLSEKGVIFISIDDNEQAALKMLCDNVFGENNFESLVWRKKGGAGNTERILGCLTEYVLCFFRKKNAGVFKYRDIERTFKYCDKNGGFNLEGIEKTNNGIYERPTMLFPIIDPKTKIEFYPKNGMRWTIGQKGVEKAIEEGKIFFDYKKKKVYYIKRAEDYQKSETVFYNLLLEHGSLSVAKDELENILGNRELFDTPKPLALITHLIGLTSVNNPTILDFFAGSGTTGHAVMKLNAEDGGQRRFILCTNNENNICRDVTYERIKRVIAKEDYKASLKYFKVDYLPISDKLYYEYADELLLHIRELVELENGINFSGNSEIAIVLTEAELDDFVANIPETCKAIYVGHDVLPTEEQEKIFAEKKIKVNVIPEYYYRDLEG